PGTTWPRPTTAGLVPAPSRLFFRRRFSVWVSGCEQPAPNHPTVKAWWCCTGRPPWPVTSPDAPCWVVWSRRPGRPTAPRMACGCCAPCVDPSPLRPWTADRWASSPTPNRCCCPGDSPPRRRFRWVEDRNRAGFCNGWLRSGRCSIGAIGFPLCHSERGELVLVLVKPQVGAHSIEVLRVEFLDQEEHVDDRALSFLAHQFLVFRGRVRVRVAVEDLPDPVRPDRVALQRLFDAVPELGGLVGVTELEVVLQKFACAVRGVREQSKVGLERDGVAGVQQVVSSLVEEPVVLGVQYVDVLTGQVHWNQYRVSGPGFLTGAGAT